MAERAAKWRLALEKRRAQPLEKILDWGRKHFPAWTDEDLHQWAEAKRQTHPNVAGGIAGHGIRWQSVANEIRCPTLLIAGDPALGAIVTPVEALEVRRLVPGARVIHIGGAGHNIRREQFDVFVSAVCRFLAELR
jgi:pimeloyl-ACP methyl ester carboxylesterase